MIKKITIVGTGYVGLSLAVLLARIIEVRAFDIDAQKIDKINHHVSPIKDLEIEQYMQDANLNLYAYSDKEAAYLDADCILIATPTNYDDETNSFDTTSIEKVMEDVMHICPTCPVIIKSTIPVGYTAKLKRMYKKDNIIFSPEFLREGRALYDNLHPSRIIIGDNSQTAHEFGGLLKSACLDADVPLLFMNSADAEAVKLFANTYLATRISFFNELDTFAEIKGLDARAIIQGIGYDPRIGLEYNNPSFGYGGYCLPKDTKQLLANYQNVPQNMIGAVVEANRTRMDHIVNEILVRRPKVVGIYRLAMKVGSDNFRQSAMLGIIERLGVRDQPMVIFEPSIQSEFFLEVRVFHDFDEFVKASSLIIANRMDHQLEPVSDRVYTRDLFAEN